MQLRPSISLLFFFPLAFALAAPAPSVFNIQSEFQLPGCDGGFACFRGPARPEEHVVLDTGAPSVSLPTGTVIFQKQSSAIRFIVPQTFQAIEETANSRKGTSAQLVSAELVLGALQSTNADVYIQICADVGGKPGGKWDVRLEERPSNHQMKRNGCLAYDSVHIDGSVRRVTLHYVPKEQVLLDLGGTYWLVLSSNAPSFTESVSWLDSDHGTAVTGFKVIGSDWQVSELAGASTAKITVKT